MPAEKSTIAMMPIVFCASFPPWPRLESEADTYCKRRNQRSIRCGAVLANVCATMTMSSIPRRKPDTSATAMSTTAALSLAASIPLRLRVFATDGLDAVPQVVAFVGARIEQLIKAPELDDLLGISFLTA